MPSTKNNISKSLLIFSSIENRLSEIVKRLSFQARQAYVNRDFKQLKNLYESLLNLGSASEDAGLFYQGLYNSQNTPLNSTVFESLVDSSIPAIRAASVLMLGGIAFRKNNYTEAQKHILTAGKIALSHNMCAPLIAYNTQDAYSGLLSAQGAHAESLSILQSNANLAKMIGFYFPATEGEFLNNSAFENLKLNNYEVALHLINKALTLPVKPYPEWFETKSDILEKIKPARSSSIIVPDSYSQREMLGNLLYFPLPKSCFQVGLSFFGKRHSILNYQLYDNDESETRFMALIDVLDSFCMNYKTQVKIEGLLRRGNEDSLILQGYVSEDDLDDLHVVIRNVKTYEARFPVRKLFQQEKTDKATAPKTEGWVMSILEENAK
jgi:hypothetical protein